ncbi:MAG: hypothetical protein QOE19_3737, partial [Actinomycetota bacterium]|nr:hypothetical protein [Actinomycetota bacterium]
MKEPLGLMLRGALPTVYPSQRDSSGS